MIPQATLPGFAWRNAGESAGKRLRDEGIAKLERHEWLTRARGAAVGVCWRQLTVTTDDLHDIVGEPPHPNCWGALFHDKRFKFTGQWVKSTRKEAHYRDLKVWELA